VRWLTYYQLLLGELLCICGGVERKEKRTVFVSLFRVFCVFLRLWDERIFFTKRETKREGQRDFDENSHSSTRTIIRRIIRTSIKKKV